MGFSYDLSSCPSLAKLNTDFANMRTKYKARYVRMYGICENNSKGTYANIVEAAAAQGLGVYALVWFGFDGDDKWKSRLSDITSLIQSNPKVRFYNNC